MRTTSGSWRVHKNFPNLPAWIVKSVGGTTTHWAGASLRFQEHEFKEASTYGHVPGANLLDWPITLADLEPYYAKAEDKMRVTRTGDRPGLPGSNNFKVFEAGADKLGYKEVHTGRMAINSVPGDGRGRLPSDRLLLPGLQVGGKVVDALHRDPEGRGDRQHGGSPGIACRADRARPFGQGDRRHLFRRGWQASATEGAHRCGRGQFARKPTSSAQLRLVEFPDGLANSSGQVGRNYMRHTTGSVYAIFEQPVHMYRGTTMAGIMRDEARNDPSRGFVGGYELETLSLGLPFMAAFLDPGAWGREFTTAIDGYSNMAGMWIVGEDMPQETNRITLSDQKDKWGLPVVDVHFDDHPNDVAMRNHAYGQGKAMYEAVGATRTFPTPPYPSTHNLGTNRMSANARDGVVNSHGQTHDIKNLFVSDGSQFTTGGAENPTLTIVTLAIRQADYIADQMKSNTI